MQGQKLFRGQIINQSCLIRAGSGPHFWAQVEIGHTLGYWEAQTFCFFRMYILMKEIHVGSYFSYVKYVDLCATINPSQIEDLAD